MTIAACFLLPEGVVLGADSTTTIPLPDPLHATGFSPHHFNYGQKIFEIGTDSTLGMATLGRASLGQTSIRTLIAQLSDELVGNPPKTMEEVAWRWNVKFWSIYNRTYPDAISRARQLWGKSDRSAEEQEALKTLRQDFYSGFCLAGYCLTDRRPQAFDIDFSPELAEPKPPEP